MKIMRIIRGVVAAAVMGGMALGQVGPPACPVIDKAAAASMRLAVPNPSNEVVAAMAEAGAADASVLVAAEPIPNFGVERFRLEEYASCTGSGGCYWADADAQAQRAEATLETLVKTRKFGEKLALVLDIDETSLSSYCELQREDFGFIPEMFNAWVVSPEAAIAMPGTLRLFRKARAAGVAVFFLTGRPEEQRAGTERNLKAAGYTDWAGVVLRSDAEKTMETVAYKSSERAKIAAKGYRLAMSIGDQWSDLNGEPRAEVSVKLPNPFYYLP
jgi:hypothetical protein